MAQPGHGDDELVLDDDVDLDLLTAPPRPRTRPRRGRAGPPPPPAGGPPGDDPDDVRSTGGGAPTTARRSPLGAWPEATPSWLRTPGALLLVALLAVAVTGALLDLRSDAATRAAVATERALLSLEVQDAALTGVVVSADPLTGNALGVPGTLTSALLEVTVVNRGGEVAFVTPVDLALEGFPDGALEPSGPVVATGSGTPRGVSAPQPLAGPLAVAAGGRSRGVVPFAVDCTAVPVPDGAGPADGEQLVVDVRVLGTERVEQLPITAGSGGLGQQIAQRCHPEAAVSVRVASSAITADGGLEVVLQDLGTVPTQVDLAGRPALEVTAEPALPLDLVSGGLTRVVLTGTPDCTLQRDPLVEGLALRALPVEAADGGTTATLDAAMTSAWWVRTVALACG